MFVLITNASEAINYFLTLFLISYSDQRNIDAGLPKQDGISASGELRHHIFHGTLFCTYLSAPTGNDAGSPQ